LRIRALNDALRHNLSLGHAVMTTAARSGGMRIAKGEANRRAQCEEIRTLRSTRRGWKRGTVEMV
jgi:hypothetical protein